jgi:hypothetical protein
VEKELVETARQARSNLPLTSLALASDEPRRTFDCALLGVPDAEHLIDERAERQ